MKQIGGDSIWNKDYELTHIVSIDSMYPSEKSRLFSDGYFATGRWKGTAIMLTTGCRLLDAEFLDGPSAVIDTAIAQLDEYFAGTRQEFNVPILFAGTDY